MKPKHIWRKPGNFQITPSLSGTARSIDGALSSLHSSGAKAVIFHRARKGKLREDLNSFYGGRWKIHSQLNPTTKQYLWVDDPGFKTDIDFWK
jgi:hypothetical protein